VDGGGVELGPIEEEDVAAFENFRHGSTREWCMAEGWRAQSSGSGAEGLRVNREDYLGRPAGTGCDERLRLQCVGPVSVYTRLFNL
jgi:hypothetical protein